MLYLSPKYVLLGELPWSSPYLIASLDVDETFRASAAARGWGESTPPLFLVPAICPGTAAFVGWLRGRALSKPTLLSGHQPAVAQWLTLTYRAAAPTPAAVLSTAFNLGHQRGVSKLPLLPEWLPEPDPVWLDPAPFGLRAPPWDGWEKWRERALRRSTPDVSAAPPAPEKPPESAPAPKSRPKARRHDGPSLFDHPEGSPA